MRARFAVLAGNIVTLFQCVIIEHKQGYVGVVNCKIKCLLNTHCLGIIQHSMGTLHCVIGVRLTDNECVPKSVQLSTERNEMKMTNLGPCQRTECKTSAETCVTAFKGFAKCVPRRYDECKSLSEWNYTDWTWHTNGLASYRRSNMETETRGQHKCLYGKWYPPPKTYRTPVTAAHLKPQRLCELPYEFDTGNMLQLTGTPHTGQKSCNLALSYDHDVVFSMNLIFKDKESRESLKDRVVIQCTGQHQISSDFPFTGGERRTFSLTIIRTGKEYMLVMEKGSSSWSCLDSDPTAAPNHFKYVNMWLHELKMY